MKNLVFVGKTVILVVIYAAIFAISIACLVSWPVEFLREAGTVPCIVSSIITAIIFLMIFVKIHMADFIVGAFISALCTFIIGGILTIFYLPMLCTDDGFWCAIVGTLLIITPFVFILRKK